MVSVLICTLFNFQYKIVQTMASTDLHLLKKVIPICILRQVKHLYSLPFYIKYVSEAGWILKKKTTLHSLH